MTQQMPLDGIKVVEVSTWVAGPSCGVWLAEWGAEVIRIEPIEGDAVRGFTQTGVLPIGGFNILWEMWNRSKKAIAVDLKTEEGQDIVHKLVKEADVFLSNLRPNTLQRIRLDYETLEKLNSRLIYASILGYGSKGPGTEWPAFDDLAFWARSGVGTTLGEPDGSYVNLKGVIGDHTTGMTMLAGITMALLQRQQTGSGQYVETSLLACGLWTAGLDVQIALNYGISRPKYFRKEAANPFVNNYRCKDGKWIVFDMAQSQRFWPIFCKAVKRDDLIDDPKYNSMSKRTENRVELIKVIDEIISAKSQQEWDIVFHENDLIFGLVQTPDQVIKDACVIENDYIVEYEHFSQGKIKGINCPFQLGKTQSRIKGGAPEFSQNTEEILLGLGYTWEDISGLKDGKVIP